MELFPNAKVNLGLNIVARRADGYHDIETIFYPIPLTDRLSVERAETFSFRQTGAPLDCQPEQNLVVRALRALTEDDKPPLAVELEKFVPSGAGLGGGSSNAAFAVKAARDLLGRSESDAELERLLAPLGADCPFFVRNSAVFATGIGDVFTPLELSLAGWQMALVKPDIHVATREAYAAVRPASPAVPLTDIVRRPVAEWQGLMLNDFEPSVFAAHPEIAAIKQRLLDLGATYSSMSGSGSSVFALFTSTAKPIQLDQLFPNCFTWWGALK